MTRWITLTLLLLLAACSRPEFDVLDGPDLRLSDLAGKTVYINYFAEWCPPCREEIPELNAFHAAEHEHRAVVLGVSYDPLAEDELRALIKQLDIRFPVLVVPPYAVLKGNRPEVMPTTYVLGPDGSLQGELLGPQTAESLGSYLAEPQP